jgi:acetoin utilization deacetylase AcuC-like enzyme
MSTAFLTHTDCLRHINPDGHPEQVARLDYILDRMSAPKFNALQHHNAPLGTDDHILTTHPVAHLNSIKAAVPAHGWTQIDGDTSVSPGTFKAALRGVGANVKAVDLVMSGEVKNAFCATRPPGHHAETQTAMGFCYFGNVVIGARHALDHHGLERVAIVDFDVHHGNGTQDLVWNDDRILFVSSHQMPLYPGSGAAHETGAHGNVLNVPLDPYANGVDLRNAFEREIMPALKAHKPQMIFISAGFDAHKADPLANLNFIEEDFAWATQTLCEFAEEHCEGRVVSTLEGGYDLEALAASVAVHVAVLMEQS